MNPIRIPLAAVVGGAVMFIWGAVSHMALPIGDMGIKNLPGEELLLPQMKLLLSERGFYAFPGMKEGEMSEEEMKEWEEKYRQGPRGAVIFDPSGAEMMSVAQLGTEFASNALAALVAAMILVRAGRDWASRTLVAGAIGVAAWLSIDVSYWNWYRFPDEMAMAGLIDQTAGWLLSGGAIALVLGRGAAAQARMA